MVVIYSEARGGAYLAAERRREPVKPARRKQKFRSLPPSLC